MSEKTRYTDEELEEFRQIILEKLALAKRDYDQMMDSLTNRDSNDVDDTSPTYKALEEGSETQSKEDLMKFAAYKGFFFLCHRQIFYKSVLSFIFAIYDREDRYKKCADLVAKARKLVHDRKFGGNFLCFRFGRFIYNIAVTVYRSGFY